MIFSSLVDETFFRAMVPRWSVAPLSGNGAARYGGRFNKIGYPALYLSSEPEIAWAESANSSLILPPRMICSYQISIAKVVDFRSGYDPETWSVEWSAWDCDWKNAKAYHHEDPISWILSEECIASGASALLYPSIKDSDSTNIVIFLANLDEGDEIEFHDPNRDLPTNQSSWI